MKRFILALSCFLLFATPVMSAELALTTPTSRQAITHIWVGGVRAYPDIKRVNYDLVMGYKSGSQLIEISRTEREINEPLYTAMQALFSTSGKPVEQVILEYTLVEFPGVVE